jgi:deoxyadenosine/deoxycytidine kinase
MKERGFMHLKISVAKQITVISGPLASGKTTLKKSLCTKLGQRVIPEFEEGIDLASPNWKNLEAYALEEGSSIVECHFS